MKFHKLFFTILLLFASFQICFGQEIQKTELVNELSYINDCTLSLGINDFLMNISSTDTKGLIIIYGTEKNQKSKYTYKKWIEWLIKYRKFPSENVSIVFGENKEIFKIVFWKIPSGAKLPDFVESPPNYKLPTEKTLIASSEAELFDLLFDLEMYADLLKANPNLVGKIVLFYNNDPRAVRDSSAKFMNQLVGKYKVPRIQIKILFSKKKVDYPHEAYWLVPKNNSN